MKYWVYSLEPKPHILKYIPHVSAVITDVSIVVYKDYFRRERQSLQQWTTAWYQEYKTFEDAPNEVDVPDLALVAAHTAVFDEVSSTSTLNVLCVLERTVAGVAPEGAVTIVLGDIRVPIYLHVPWYLLIYF